MYQIYMYHENWYVTFPIHNTSPFTNKKLQLIKESNEGDFVWHFDPIHKEAFQNLKDLMVTAPVLKYYSLNDPITISCDASQRGLGCSLFQRDHPVAYASKALTDAEFAYAQIEKELLAIVFAFKKFHTYVYGRHDITVQTDHAPLVRILEKPLYQVPLRLQRMILKLQHYDFKLVAKRGSEIPVADALSRAFLKDTGPNLTEDDSHIFSVTAKEVKSTSSFSQERLTEVKEETAKDPALQRLISVLTADRKSVV